MRNLDIYITEKLHLDKNISTNITFDSPFMWMDYLRSNGAKLYKDNRAYIICLKKSTNYNSKHEFTYPCIVIELDIENKQWNSYWYEYGKLSVLGDDKDKHKLFIDLKELDRNTTNKPRGNYYTSKNADILLKYLEELYNIIK